MEIYYMNQESLTESREEELGQEGPSPAPQLCKVHVGLRCTRHHALYVSQPLLL